jgi:lauroyl/myristoyl acyltransferase
VLVPRTSVEPKGGPRPGYHRLARALAPRLPRRARVGLAAALGRRSARWFPAAWAAVRANLARIHPAREAEGREAIARRLFENFAICLADRMALGRGRAAEIWACVDGVDRQEATRRALAAGRGCVCLTAHLGNWELAGRALARLGRPVHVVMAPEPGPEAGALMRPDERDGVRVVRRESPLAAVGLAAALRRGEVVACQMDRATGERTDRRAPFFGTPAAFPLGPFLLAAAVGAPVVPAFCVLDERRRYRLAVEPPIEVRRGAEVEGLATVIAVLERYVGRHADQWFNFFDVWESPDAPPGPSAGAPGDGHA